MINVNYQKRKNAELFKSLEEQTSLFLSNAQNYIPIYNKFFSLNETNYNNINLNNKWHLSSVNEKLEDNMHLYNCRVKNFVTNKVKDREVFFKMAPLLDPYKYLIGKYTQTNEKLFLLPCIPSNEADCHPKMIDVNNSAYVDGLFLYLSSQLIYTTHFPHGVDYFGSFLGIKNDFTLNIFDDIDYLNTSDFFNKHKNILFKVDNYDHLFPIDEKPLKPICIDHNSSAKSQLSIHSVDAQVFDEVFDDNLLNLDDLKNRSMDLIDITNISILEKSNTNEGVTLKSSSTCSSRSSHTNDETDLQSNSDYEEDEDDKDDEDGEKEDEDDEDDEDDDDDEVIHATIPKFPVQVICMEYCENTFDNLIIHNELTQEEWYSAFMQIIMILITYQKCFHFTHNDLHTNNIMYNTTNTKYLYYCYKNFRLFEAILLWSHFSIKTSSTVFFFSFYHKM